MNISNQTLAPVSTQWQAIAKKGNVVKISKSLQIVMLSTIALGLQSSGHAQGNLVNLYNWTNKTMYTVAPQVYVHVQSSNSAEFMGGYASFPYITNGFILVAPILTGSLDTTPGTTYEITFTMQNMSIFFGQADMSFGDFTANCNLTAFPNYTNTVYPPYPPVNFDFTAVASSPTTMMSFQCGLDNADAILLSNLEVTEVPEISTAGLFGFGGCAILLAQRWRRLFQKRKRN